MNKLTKIIATLGPVSDSVEMIEKLILHGVNIFRFNFKHSTVDWHSERIERVNKVAKKSDRHIGTLIDLQGPSLRVNMPEEQLEIEKDELLVFGEEVFEKGKSDFAKATTGKKGFSITHPNIISHLHEGQKILADDGSFIFYVVKKNGKVYLRSETTGILKIKKNLNIPGSDFPFPILIDRDFEGLELAARNEVDFIALSFVRSAYDLQVVRKEAEKFGLKAKIIAKIETQRGLDHIDEIVKESDGIMVARGDLGVEIPIEQVPYYQKLMIKKCMAVGKPVITATQMLQSMVENPFPTRAEVSDVANAVYDETDAVMLSAESASGAYPLKAVDMMQKTVAFNEPKRTEDFERTFEFAIEDTTSMVCDTAYGLYLQYVRSNQKIAGFLVFTQTGRTAQLLSRYRAKIPIFTFSPNSEVADILTMHFGVIPFYQKVNTETEVTRQAVNKVIQLLTEKKYIDKGSKLIVLHGDKWGVEGGTSTVRIVEV